ncbi:MAG: aldehyde ferredoxin oxidoreductase N-terminal domain-containing protein [Mailhella sp.]
MKGFFLNSMLIADMETGEAVRQPLPADVAEKGDLSALSLLYPHDVVLACGLLSGSFAPSSCVLTLYADGMKTMLKGHVAPALRRCGLDAIVLRGKGEAPRALVADEEREALLPLDAEADVPSQRRELERLAKNMRGMYADSSPECLIAGPAAFQDSNTSAVCLSEGAVSRSTAAALAMARRRIAGVCLNGCRYSVPAVALSDSARAQAPVVRLKTSLLGDIIRLAKPGFSGRVPVVGRSIACYGCPAPCGFWLKAEKGCVACTDAAALSVLLEKGLSDKSIAAVLKAAARFGIDPAYVIAEEGHVPECLSECLKNDISAPSAVDLDEASLDGMRLGVCPLYLKRFPNMHELLKKYLAG